MDCDLYFKLQNQKSTQEPIKEDNMHQRYHHVFRLQSTCLCFEPSGASLGER